MTTSSPRIGGQGGRIFTQGQGAESVCKIKEPKCYEPWTIVFDRHWRRGGRARAVCAGNLGDGPSAGRDIPLGHVRDQCDRLVYSGTGDDLADGACSDEPPLAAIDHHWFRGR